jgi:thiamine pyrophosphokinase
MPPPTRIPDLGNASGGNIVSLSASSSDTAVILLGGGSLAAEHVGELPERSLVVAADSGVVHAPILGLVIDAVVGDMDSIDADELHRLRTNGTNIIEYPPDKDQTDAELALLHAVACGARRVIVIGAGGGRLDHQLSLYALLFLDELHGLYVEARFGASRVYPLRGGEQRTIDCRAGMIVGLIPFGDDAIGVTTDGLLWPLDDETLRLATSRGVSNRSTKNSIVVGMRDGRLLITVDSAESQGVNRASA